MFRPFRLFRPGFLHEPGNFEFFSEKNLGCGRTVTATGTEVFRLFSMYLAREIYFQKKALGLPSYVNLVVGTVGTVGTMSKISLLAFCPCRNRGRNGRNSSKISGLAETGWSGQLPFVSTAAESGLLFRPAVAVPTDPWAAGTGWLQYVTLFPGFALDRCIPPHRLRLCAAVGLGCCSVAG